MWLGTTSNIQKANCNKHQQDKTTTSVVQYITIHQPCCDCLLKVCYCSLKSTYTVTISYHHLPSMSAIGHHCHHLLSTFWVINPVCCQQLLSPIAITDCCYRLPLPTAATTDIRHRLPSPNAVTNCCHQLLSLTAITNCCHCSL